MVMSRDEQLAMKMPGLMFQAWEKIPAPPRAALFGGLAGVGLAVLFGRSEKWWKWGLAAGGGAFLGSTIVKGTFAAGMMTGGMMTAQACAVDPSQVAAMLHYVVSPTSPVPTWEETGLW